MGSHTKRSFRDILGDTTLALIALKALKVGTALAATPSFQTHLKSEGRTAVVCVHLHITVRHAAVIFPANKHEAPGGLAMARSSHGPYSSWRGCLPTPAA